MPNYTDCINIIRHESEMKRKSSIDRGLIGNWISYDENGSTIEHRISMAKGEYKVTCVDTYDGELAEVYDVKWDGNRLSYCLHWPSTRRFSRNSILRQSQDQVELTFTYTDTELLRRKPVRQAGRKRKTQAEQRFSEDSLNARLLN